MRIAIVGGDARMPYAARALAGAGHEVTLSAHGEVPLSPEALSHAEAVLLPMPLSRDGVHLHAPLSPLPVPLEPLFSMLPEDALLLAGKEDAVLRTLAGHRPLLSYGTGEAFWRRNSYTTAEGAISILLGRLLTTLSETPCLLLGSGHLAVALLDLLLGLHTPVTVFARNTAPLPFGIRPLPLSALPAEIGRFPVILNTVPVRLLDASLLRRAAAGALLLELSSVPAVLDEAAVREAGITLVSAPALPGRFAPDTAGRTVADAVTAILTP